MSQGSRLITGIIVGIVLGSAGVYVFVSPTLNDYASLERQLLDEKQDNTGLSSELNSLLSDYEELVEDFQSLNREHVTLTSDYLSLETENAELSSDLDHANENWLSLSDDVFSYYSELRSFTNVEDSFSRIFSIGELDKIADVVDTVSKREDDNWQGYYNIHTYVRDDIIYAYDAEIPVISTYTYYGEVDSPEICEFKTTYRRNLLQSLEYSVEYQQGDCDDQAILEYAMIQYYRKYICGTLYSLYLAHIEFESGDSHLAVFMPVVDGQICILDPAGQYQTGGYYYIQSKKAGVELRNYEDHWENQFGGISSITLWTIDIMNGDYTEYFEGSLTEAIEFFSNT